MKFSVGEIVNAYDYEGSLSGKRKGTIVRRRGECAYLIDHGDGIIWYHEKQLRKLKPKTKLREWWVNEKAWKVMPAAQSPAQTQGDWVYWFEQEDCRLIRTTKPQSTEGWIHIKEQGQKK